MGGTNSRNNLGTETTINRNPGNTINPDESGRQAIPKFQQNVDWPDEPNDSEN